MMLKAQAMTRIESWTRANPELGWRIYRTRAGLRLLATQGLVEADSAVANGVFRGAGGRSALPQTLQDTEMFPRPALTPKPWRCGIRRKPERWPWLDARAEKQFQKWEAQYQSFSANWATCEFIRHIGNPDVHADIQSRPKTSTTGPDARGIKIATGVNRQRQWSQAQTSAAKGTSASAYLSLNVHFGGLVPEHHHAEQPAGPATERAQQREREFGDALTGATSAAICRSRRRGTSPH